MNEPIFSMLSGKGVCEDGCPNGFVATGIPSSWELYGLANGLTYSTGGNDQNPWIDNDFEDYKFEHTTDWPCNCGDYETLINGWFFWAGAAPMAFAESNPDRADRDQVPPSSGWQEWNYSEDCSGHNVSACGGSSQSINLTFTPV
jgi:hypothetical protein